MGLGSFSKEAGYKADNLPMGLCRLVGVFDRLGWRSQNPNVIKQEQCLFLPFSSTTLGRGDSWGAQGRAEGRSDPRPTVAPGPVLHVSDRA